MQVSLTSIDYEISAIVRVCVIRLRKDSRGAPREARCECNDQVEMCG